MENTYCIYCHTSPSGKRYIGQTKHGDNPNKRWCDGKHHSYLGNPYFSNAINKYGWDNFTHEIIEENLTLDEANEKEQYWISYYDSANHDNGYNIRLGGNNSELTQETKDKISNSLKEYFAENGTSDETRFKQSLAMKEFYALNGSNPVDEDVKEQISQSLKNYYKTDAGIEQRKKSSEFHKQFTGEKNPNYGKPMSEENKEKDRLGHLGKKHTVETKLQMSIVKSGENNPFYGKHHSEESKQRIRENQPHNQILCVETNMIYDGLREAERQTGIPRGVISKCCRGLAKTSGGYHWQFYKEEVTA